jgi:hypothetical protein
MVPLSYLAPTNPAAFVYHVDWPGSDLLSPVFHAYKIDLSNNQTEIGTYQTLAAAQAACQSDYAGPQTPLKAPATVFA